MTDAEQKAVDQIEADRKEREDALFLLLLIVAHRSRLYINHAVRDGSGVPTLNLPTLSDALAAAMADSYLSGYSRAGELAGVDLLHGEDPEGTPEYAAALARYQVAARQQASDTADTFEQLAKDAIASVLLTESRTKIGGEVEPPTAKKKTDAIDDAFIAAGWSRKDPQEANPESTGEAGFAAQSKATGLVLEAHGDGMQDAFAVPVVADAIENLGHFSVVDEVTTDICLDRVGLVLPVRHPYWRENWVPLHFGCRSVIMPVPKGTPVSDWLPTIPPMIGFGTAPTAYL